MPRKTSPLLVAAVLGLALTACGADGESAEDAAAPASSSAPASAEPEQTTTQDAEPDGADEPTREAPGRLVGWADYESDPGAYAGSDVVLYFHADWCHECQATDAALEADGVPAGLTLVQIDYDERTDLRQQFGVTVQHTFVLVDDSGEKVEAWTGTTTGAEIADRAA